MSTINPAQTDHDALLIVGFGGPEGREDVIPFLENVLRGRPVPRERMLEVAEHYYHFDGVSPINGQVRELIAALKPELARQGVDLPVYWGNRNWHPMLTDTVRAMAEAGVKRALGVVLSAYSSYSGCRQYREDIIKAREAVGAEAPTIDKMRVFYNHPDFIEVNARKVREALERFPEDRRASAVVAFTAHSIPDSMAVNCNYEKQLMETCRLVAEESGVAPGRWSLVYQSRSGRPTDPWLGPDILEHLDALKEQGASEVVVQPVGFLSDHMEVMFDLDEEASHRARELGLNMVRAGTAGVDPTFVGMLAELIRERITRTPDRRAVGQYPANHDVCPVDCCLPPPRPARPASS
ncbi:ferrochelatase [Tundrisphaera lichenicola]|uniref:ferrochelatase n=1 Tax=Tundrisphaera lichenicola TaxID=2029860 RepID=UPI003EB96099